MNKNERKICILISQKQTTYDSMHVKCLEHSEETNSIQFEQQFLIYIFSRFGSVLYNWIDANIISHV